MCVVLHRSEVVNVHATQKSSKMVEQKYQVAKQYYLHDNMMHVSFYSRTRTLTTLSLYEHNERSCFVYVCHESKFFCT